MEEGIQLFALIHLTTMGVSHVLRPKVWIDFFVRLREWGEPAVFAVGFLSLIFGSIVVAFHNVWQGIPLLVTVFGWLHVAKGLVYFAFPAVGLKGLGRVDPVRPGRFVGAGFALLALAGALGYHLWTS